MEVHHHTHTARKKFMHYFWEFLMLFLAVFCGFMAENVRENMIEKHRAKDYAKSLVADLMQDTTEIRSGVDETRFLLTSIDSIHDIISRNRAPGIVPGKIYYFARFTTTAYLIDWNRSTIDQLIQSGNLRYLKNKELVNKINAYYAQQNLITSQNNTDREHRTIIMTCRNRILMNKYFKLFAMLRINEERLGHVPNPSIDSLIGKDLPLQPNGEQYVDEFLNYLSDRKFRLRLVIETHYVEAIKNAEDIIKELRKEYHLGEDKR